MYRITVQALGGNEFDIYYPGDRDYVLTNAVLNYDAGLAGEFNFTIPYDNPAYEKIVQNSIITIYKDNAEYWRGDIRDIKTTFNKSLEVYCLEDLSWLGDEPLAMTQVTDQTNMQRFTSAINTYNSNQVTKRQFTVGQLTAVSTSGLCSWVPEYGMSILDGLRQFIAGSNGYLKVRRVTPNGVVTRYIDIITLADYGKMSNQNIEFGSNLLDYAKVLDATNIVNALYPYGAETETELYGDIMQRIAGTPIQNDTSIAAYGRRAKSVVFDTEDSTTLNNLASAYLSRYSQPHIELEITAVDLGSISAVDEFAIGDSVRVLAPAYAIDQRLYITNMSVDLLNPAANQIKLTDVVRSVSLTSQVQNQATEIKDIRSPLSVLDEAKRNAMSILQGENGGIVTFEVNGQEQIVGILIANNLDIEQATKAWGWNINGLCYVHRTYPTDDWTLGIAMTMNGEIVADYITTGEMSADRINGGHIRANLITALNSALVQVMDESADYSGAYVPNDLTSPTYNWNTEALKKQHEGDTFLNTSTNKGYVYSYVNDYPESDHPYDEHSHDYYYKFTLDSLSGPIKITFDSQCKTETGWDYVDIFYIYENDTYTKRYTGNFGGLEAVIPVNEFYLHFYTDGSNNEWGWKIDSIEHTDDPLTGFTTGSALPTPANGWNEVTGKHYYQWIETNLANYIAQKATAEVNNMSAEQMFELLTDGGNVQGMFFQNDQVYFNATYIKTGFLSANIIKTGDLLADRIKGGTLTLGGYNDINGRIYLVSALNYIDGTTGTDNYTTYLGYAQTSAEGECVGVIEINNLSQDAASLMYTVTYCEVSGGIITETTYDTGTFDVDSGSNTFTLPKKMEIANNANYYKINVKKGYFDTLTFDVGVNYAIVYGTLGENGIKTIRGSFGNLQIDGTENSIYTLGYTELYKSNTLSSYTKRFTINNKFDSIFISSFKIKLYFTGTVASGQSYPDGTEAGTVVLQRRLYTNNTFSNVETKKFTFNTEIEFSTTINVSDFDTYIYRLSISLTSVSSKLSACERKITTNEYRLFEISESGLKGYFDGTLVGKADLTGLSIGEKIYYDKQKDALFSEGTNATAEFGDGVIVRSSNMISSANYDGAYIGKSPVDSRSPVYYVGYYENYNSNEYVEVFDSGIIHSHNGTISDAQFSASDERVKEDIKDLPVELSRKLIDATKTKTFRYKGDTEFKHYGMIAQEARVVLDDLGETDAGLEYEVKGSTLDNQRNIKYQEYIPHLINYVKQLRADIEALKIKLKEEEK